jgi:hypothetical protein
MRAADLSWPALIVLTMGLLAAPADAQDYGVDAVPYPSSSTSEPIVQDWINRYLPTKGYVVGAWSPNVVMLVSVDALKTDAYPQVTTEVLSEVLRPEAANAAGWRAALQTLVFDCAKDQYRSLSDIYFARGDRQGGFNQDSGDGVWHTPDPDATMDTVERAACFYGLRNRRANEALGAAPAPGLAPTGQPPAHRSASTGPKPAKTTQAKHVRAKPKTAPVKPGQASKSHKTVPAKTAPATPSPPAHPKPQPEVSPQLHGFTLQ